jgi:hypothetical protein
MKRCTWDNIVKCESVEYPDTYSAEVDNMLAEVDNMLAEVDNMLAETKVLTIFSV